MYTSNTIYKEDKYLFLNGKDGGYSFYNSHYIIFKLPPKKTESVVELIFMYLFTTFSIPPI